MEGISSFDQLKDDNNVRLTSGDSRSGVKSTYFVSGWDGNVTGQQYGIF